MKTIYFIRGIIAFFLVLVIGTASAYTVPVCHPAIPKIQKKGVLTVGMVNDAASQNIPALMKQKDSMIMQDLAAALNVKIKLDNSYASFDAVIDAVAAHKVDVGISFLSITNARLLKVNYSLPYISFMQDIVLSQKSWEKFQNKNQLLNKLDHHSIKIAIIRKSSYEQFSKGLIPKAQLIPFADWNAIVVALQNNQVDASIMDDLVYRIFFSDKQNYHFKRVPLGGFFHDHIAIAIPKTSCDLTKFIDNYFVQHSLNAIAPIPLDKIKQ